MKKVQCSSESIRVRELDFVVIGGTGDWMMMPCRISQFISVLIATNACFCSDGVDPSFDITAITSLRVI